LKEELITITKNLPFLRGELDDRSLALSLRRPRLFSNSNPFSFACYSVNDVRCCRPSSLIIFDYCMVDVPGVVKEWSISGWQWCWLVVVGSGW
jgi:hypothetical protein